MRLSTCTTRIGAAANAGEIGERRGRIGAAAERASASPRPTPRRGTVRMMRSESTPTTGLVTVSVVSRIRDASAVVRNVARLSITPGRSAASITAAWWACT
jgi:hypothetical protein